MPEYREGHLPPDRLQLIRLPHDFNRKERAGVGSIVSAAVSALAAFILMAAFLTFLIAPVRLIETIPAELRIPALVLAVIAVTLSAIWLILAGLRQRTSSARRYQSRRA